jgi:hypothetical protein
MAVTIKNYNHNAARFAAGLNAVGDTYKVVLLSSSATHDATHTTLAEVTSTGANEVSGNGWDAGGEALSGVAVTTVNTDDAKWTADTLTVLITGGDLTFRNYAIVNTTDTDSPPLCFIERTSDVTFYEDTNGVLSWPADGIISLVKT